MITDAQNLLVNYPHLAIFPGLAIFFTVYSFNMLGDGLRDALDPRMRGSRWSAVPSDPGPEWSMTFQTVRPRTDARLRDRRHGLNAWSGGHSTPVCKELDLEFACVARVDAGVTAQDGIFHPRRAGVYSTNWEHGSELA